ncbi:MAG: signal peptidase I [Clostridiaceae bacterium]|jgi:signal peptidase I|nr:signal peptidase I [Clostridiaceae bacterium]
MNKEQIIEWYKKNKPAIKETVETTVFVITMVILIRFFVCELRWIPSGSMKPTLIEGDRIVVERFTRFYSAPKRGDIMVFYPPFEKISNSPVKVFTRLLGLFCKDVAYIKRVVGVPGDKVQIKEDKNGKYTVYINDKPLDEPYIMSPYDFTPCSETVNCGPFTIPKGKYFMMGDNRGSSFDGRFWGLLPQDRFVGRAVVIFWPLNRLRILNSK